jgi:ATP-binding cassette subfamily G (WHITE) protein 2 (SNQ2)
MQGFMSFAGGYLANPEDSASCQFCSVRSSDQFLAAGFNIFYHNRWRDFGFMMVFTGFNVGYR